MYKIFFIFLIFASIHLTTGHRRRSSASKGGTGIGLNLFVDSPILSSKLSGRLTNANENYDFLSKDHLSLSEGDVLVNELLINNTISNEINGTMSDDEELMKKKKREIINLWPAGQVKYQFHPSITPPARKLINQAMEHIEKRTCIKFVPKVKKYKFFNSRLQAENSSETSNVDNNNSENLISDELNVADVDPFINIFKGPPRSCFSMIGRRDPNEGGEFDGNYVYVGQKMSLGSGCYYHGVIVHELVHAIGLRHVHSRPDRDNYIHVLWDNILPTMRSQFKRVKKVASTVDTLALKVVPFDYESIMLYGSKLFSLNGDDTMIPLRDGVELLDTAIKFGLSPLDVKVINKLYNCPDVGWRKKNTPKSQTPTITQTPTATTRTPTTQTPTTTTISQTREPKKLITRIPTSREPTKKYPKSFPTKAPRRWTPSTSPRWTTRVTTAASLVPRMTPVVPRVTRT